jgi:soluble lytic murein transglycosylase
MQQDPKAVLRDPERNLQIGCWYLEGLYEQYRDLPGAEARMIAGYNAGPSRAAAWNQAEPGAPPLTANEFIARIDIPSTRAYVTSIMERYRKLKEEHARPTTITPNANAPNNIAPDSDAANSNVPEAVR